MITFEMITSGLIFAAGMTMAVVSLFSMVASKRLSRILADLEKNPPTLSQAISRINSGAKCREGEGWVSK